MEKNFHVSCLSLVDDRKFQTTQVHSWDFSFSLGLSVWKFSRVLNMYKCLTLTASCIHWCDVSRAATEPKIIIIILGRKPLYMTYEKYDCTFTLKKLCHLHTIIFYGNTILSLDMHRNQSCATFGLNLIL